jgi:hypothetical protein
MYIYPCRQYIHPTVYTVYTKVYVPFTFYLPRVSFSYIHTGVAKCSDYMYADRDGMGAEVRENGKNNKKQQNWVRGSACVVYTAQG